MYETVEIKLVNEISVKVFNNAEVENIDVTGVFIRVGDNTYFYPLFRVASVECTGYQVNKDSV